MNSQVMNVVRFEVMRTLKKPSFWFLTMLFPVMIMVISILSGLGSKSAVEAAMISEDEQISFVYQDDSGLVDEAIARQAGGEPIDSFESKIDAVKSGEINAAIFIPESFSDTPIRIVAQDRGLLANTAYDTLISGILRKSVSTSIDNEQILDVLNRRVDVAIETYTNGKPAITFGDTVAPGMFLILFYFSIVLLGNQMLNATVEEKENRVTEIVLTSMNPMHLLFGKVVGIFILGIVQVITLILTVLLFGIAASIYFAGADGFSQGTESLSSAVGALSFAGIPIDPVRTFLGMCLFFSAFVMVSGLLTMTGAMVGNAKDAGQVFGFVVMGLMLPYMAFLLIVNQPEHIVTKVLTWFPLSSPIAVMLRNAVGNMDPLWVGIALAMQFIVGGIFFSVGARLFGTGALAYQGMSVKQALSTLVGR